MVDTLSPGTIRSIATFNHPFHGSYDGKAVRILATGDQEGKSPVYLCVDETGRSSWQAIGNVQVFDPNTLPWFKGAAGEATTRQMTGSLTGSGR